MPIPQLMPVAVFGVVLLLYLLPLLAAWRRGIHGGAQLFICVTLGVSLVMLLPSLLVLMSMRVSAFSIAAAGASLIIPSLLWFAAFAAGCLIPGRARWVLPVSTGQLSINQARAELGLPTLGSAAGDLPHGR